ncbi:MAG: hypothetical protein E7Z84_05350 [Methanosphaera stadtmanae]|nr:hypothetical protein [Methanosphaera stadtmanae]
MVNWKYDRLDEMTKQSNEFTSVNLNYRFIADNFEDIVITTHNNGELIPSAFEDVKIACDNDPFSEIELPEISTDISDNINDKKRQRKLMEIKHTSRDITHKDWFNYLDNEVIEFVDKFPQFKNVIIENND